MEKVNDKVIRFANEAGFDVVDYYSSYKEYEVYAISNSGDLTFTGYPVFVLFDNNVRFSTPDETMEIMGITAVASANGEVL